MSDSFDVSWFNRKSSRKGVNFAVTLYFISNGLSTISFSRSYTRRSAGVWHLPAERALSFPPRTCFHKCGDTLKPTIISNICRACWAFTKFISKSVWYVSASKMAFWVISWKIIRFVVAIGKSNMVMICHAIPSPSRSSSVATNTAFFGYCAITFFIHVTWDAFSLIMVNFGS